MTRTISLEQLAADPGAIARDVAKNQTRVVLEQNGQPLAALVPMAVLTDDEERQRGREAFFGAMRAVSASMKQVPQEEIDALVAECVAEVRAERGGDRPSDSGAPVR